MKIDICMPGKISDKPYLKLIDLYLERCAGRIKVNLQHFKGQNELFKAVSTKAPLILLDEHATPKNTMDFVAWLERHLHSGVNSLTICLGAAEGHESRLIEKATEHISLSPLTLNHQLALLVLAEQLYRAVSIMYNEPYHKM
jgi:23S rRNA (pseudouridine1915-N3)-methyltransferase